jgi:hypothetical protein
MTVSTEAASFAGAGAAAGNERQNVQFVGAWP